MRIAPDYMKKARYKHLHHNCQRAHPHPGIDRIALGINAIFNTDWQIAK